MATIPITTTVQVTRLVAVENLSQDEQKELIKRYCSLKEIQRAKAEQLFPFSYLLQIAVTRAQVGDLDFF